ncbi:MAG: 50S ribosomal protein L3 [Patescibacteria group bacterium]
MKFISGKKSSMTQIWSGDKVLAVTPVLAGPCTITQVKIKAKDGYEALQLAYGVRREKNIKKPQLGHFKAAGVKPAHVKEFRTDQAADFKVGDIVSVGTFKVGDKLDVTGISKGRGFQGVVKRHGFHGFRKTHGNKDQERMPGSIGPKGPAHVFKGTRMGGRMGGVQVTVTNLEVAAIDEKNNIIFIQGAVPGSINGFLTIKAQGDLQVNLNLPSSVVSEVAATEVKDEPIVEVKEAPAVEVKEPVSAAPEITEENKS